MARGKKGFDQEFINSALKLLEKGYTQKQAAQELGCSLASVTSWKRKFGNSKPATEEGWSAEEEAEWAKEEAPKKTRGRKPAAKSEHKPKRKKAAKKAAKKTVKRTAKKTVKRARTADSNFDTFIREYWNRNDMVGLMLDPPQKGAEVVDLVNNAMAYCYANLK